MAYLIRRTLVLLAVLSLASSGAFGYYFYIHFNSRAVFNGIPEKFDVSALKNKTVLFFISDSGPSQLATGDSFTALVSEIRLAAKTWNDVDSSDLRIGFGGITPVGAPQNTPGIDVVFDGDIPPGIIAYGGVTTCVGPSPGTCSVVTSLAGSPFVSITRSTMRIRQDLRDLPSFGEDSFTNLVHEFGHTLGLQHTLTASAMSTAVTRSTTKAKPLADDDVAAISILYPTGNFLAQTGTISGRVTSDGAGVNLASVVAISANGPAVSTLTNPDGNYTLQGIPTGQSYVLYVHPLPPPTSAESRPAGILPPKDPNGIELPVTTYFDTVFYPNTKDPNQATPFFIGAGDVRTGQNFAVNRRGTPAISSVTTFGYYDSTGIHPAPLVSTGTAKNIVARGTGLVNGTAPASGLSVTVLGPAGAVVTSGAPKYYTDGYIYFGVAPSFGASSGPRHLMFSANNDIYVLPSAVLLVPSPPPSIASLTPGTDERGGKIVTINGSNFDSSTRILFDGVTASVVRRGDGNIVVTPPPASGGYRASVVAMNGDGQSSLFLQATPLTYLYDPSDAPFLNVNPPALTAGSEAMVEITGANTAFVDGAALGFGTSDVSVRRVWVTGPNRILANVSVNPTANTGSSAVTVASGLQIATQSFGFQTLAANPRQTIITPPVTNAATGAAGVPAGGIAVMNVSNLNGTATTIALTVGDLRANVLSVNNGQVTFQVPQALGTGPAVVKLQQPSGDPVLPVVMNIDVPPPSITAAFSSTGTTADSTHPALRGFVIGFAVSGLPDASTFADFSSLHMNVGGIDHPVVSVLNQNGAALVQILLNPSVATGTQVPVTITYSGAVSQPFQIPIR